MRGSQQIGNNNDNKSAIILKNEPDNSISNQIKVLKCNFLKCWINLESWRDGWW